MTTGIGTCNAACWQAQEEVCRCMCDGVNHGVMRPDADGVASGSQPGRYCQRQGRQYELFMIVDDSWVARRLAHRLAGDWAAAHGQSYAKRPDYGFEQQATGHMLKWPEVVEWMEDNKEAWLVWERMA